MPEEHNNDTTVTHILKLVIVAILCFVAIILVFGVGMFVGQQRAQFSYYWAENYHRNFGGPQKGIFGNFPEQDFINPHGIFGKVMTLDAATVVIKGQDNMEKTVIVSPQTTIRNNTKILKLSDIKINDTVVVIGSPDSHGQIEAKFIRVLPAGSSYMPGRNSSNT